MSFELNTVLPNAQQYRDADYNVNYKSSDYKPMVNYSEVSKILENWSKKLFKDIFFKEYQFMAMQRNYQGEIKKEDELDVRTSTVAMSLHSLTYEDLAKNQAPTAENLEKIQKVFQNFAETLEGDETAELKKEAIQLSLHPRLLSKCSEEFIFQVAKGLGQEDKFSHSVESTLNSNKEMHESNPKTAEALKEWANLTFLPEFATIAGQKELNSAVTLPYFSYYAKSAEDSYKSAAKYIASIIVRANKTEEDKLVNDEDVKAIEKMFDDLSKHFEDLHTGYILHTPKVEAREALEKAKEALIAHNKESTERKANLTAKLQEAETNLKEAVSAQKSYSSLKEKLTKTVEKRDATAQGAKQTLEDTVKADTEKGLELTKAVAEAQTTFNDLNRLATKRGVVTEDKAFEFTDEVFDMIQTLKNNVPLAIMCMEDYLKFAEARACREVEKSSSLLGRFKIW